MRALVTGGGGFLGLHLVERLVARGDSVRVLCRGQYPRLDELGVELLSGDVRDPASAARACAGIETVFHVAAVSGIWGSWKHYHSINTQGTLNILAGCRQHRVPRLVYTSSPSVVFDGGDHQGADESLTYPTRFLCHYPHSKALAEQAVLAANGSAGLSTVSLRPHLIWGPRDNHLVPRLIARARSGRLRRVGAGKNQVSMSYVENAAAAHIQAAERLEPASPVAGRAYFINEPEPVNLWEWINRLLAAAGLPAVTKSISKNAAYLAGAALESIYGALHLSSEPPMTRFLALQLGGSHHYSVARAQHDFGYRPIISVDEGLRRLEPELRGLVRKTSNPGAAH